MKKLIYRLKRPYHFFKTGLLKGVPAQLKYHFPARKIKIISITGTDGKTTTSTLIYHLLKTAGKKVGLISTVAAYIEDEQLDTGLHVTAPTPDKLQKYIKKMVDKDCEYLVLELTSHGIYQFRSWGIKPKIAGLTNITKEHLDYHLNYDLYLDAKAKLLRKAKTVFLNRDDHSYPKVRECLRPHKQEIKTYSEEDKFSKKIDQAIKKRFSAAYNRMNAHLAVKISEQVGIEENDIAQGLASFPGVPGRMQEIKTEQNFSVIVDFAHTPNALLESLKALRQKMDKRLKKNRGRLIAVYGCAGLRDRNKRPAMGKIGVDYADLAVFTAEDPRTENIWSIIRQMKEQLESGHQKIISIADRKKAIEFALTKIANKNDVVAIFGKGPEKSMCLGQTEYPWSDVKIVKQVLKQK